MEEEKPKEEYDENNQNQINNNEQILIQEQEQNNNEEIEEEQFQSNNEMENNEQENIEQNMNNNNNSDFINNNNNINPKKKIENNENNNDLNEAKYVDEEDYNNNNNNNNEENNENENFDEPQELLNYENMDESLKNFIFDLQNKLNVVMNENDKLRMMNQKMGKMLNDLKKTNIFLNQKANNMHLQNQKLSQDLMESLEENSKLKQMKNNNIDVNNYEKIIAKLNNDKKILEAKLGNMNIQTSNQIQNQNLSNYKSNKLINSPKMKPPFIPTNTSPNQNYQPYKNEIIILEKNNKKLSLYNTELENQNKYLQKENQRMFVDIKNKENYIMILKEKMESFNLEYNRQINNLFNDNNKCQYISDQLFIERDKLAKENNELKNEIKKLKEIMMAKGYKNIEYIHLKKLEEYKMKIATLKNRIKELLGCENQGNYFTSGGNSNRFGYGKYNTNYMKKTKSFKNYKNLNILTDLNMYSGQTNSTKDFRKIYSNLNFETN